MDWQNLLWISGGTVLVVYPCFLFVIKIVLPRKLRSENRDRSRILVKEAKRQAKSISKDAAERANQKISDERDDLEAEARSRMEDLRATEEDLQTLEESVAKAEQHLEKRNRELHSNRQRAGSYEANYRAKVKDLEEQRRAYVGGLEASTGLSSESLKAQMAVDMFEKRQLEAQRVLKDLEENVNLNAKKMAVRMIHRIEARYEPNFVWPKATNHIEIADSRIADTLNSDSRTFITDLKEVADGVQIEVLQDDDKKHPPAIKFAGGFGVHREAAKLAAESLLKKGPSQWSKAVEEFDFQLQKLNREAEELGKRAAIELKLEDIHLELLRMVGNLNWRTSYRQNQYLHTVEVAKLAGILAHEVGVDPDFAKRAGLFHDIGKTLDYRIDGSHAVISADYADRYGELRVVCDTCMSHHNDLVLETPLSYVLKTADTLSGARPGARVNLEEGYQIRLSAIEDAVRSFQGIGKVAIMNGGREVHVEVNHKRVGEEALKELTEGIARKIEEDVAFPGQIKVMVSRRFEATSVA